MDETTGTLVVGVDGSPGSCAALEYALQDAARRGARLRVVVAVRLPEYWSTAHKMGVPPPPPEIVASARAMAQDMVDSIVAARGETVAPLPIDVTAAVGAPAAVLLQAARGADGLVIGHRGRGGVASALVGSVGMQCVLHARCPVTVVRPTAIPPEQQEDTSIARSAPARA